MNNKLKLILGIFVTISLFSFYNISSVKAETSITITDKLEFNSINDLKNKYPNTYNKAKSNIEVLKNRCREKYGNDFKYFAYYDNTYDFDTYETGERVYSSLTCWNYKADVGNDTFNFYIDNANNIFGHLSFLTKSGYLSLYNFSDNPNNINERELNYNYNEDVNVIYENSLFLDRSIYWVDTNVDEIVFDSHEPQFNSYVSLIDSVQLNGNIYKKGDVIIKNNSIYNPIVNPEISFKMVDSEKFKYLNKSYYSSQKWQVKFSSVDNEKYYYAFSTDEGKNWKTITMVNQSYFEKTFTTNGNMIVKIIDKNTHEDVKIATLQLTDFEKYNIDGTVYNNVLKIRLADLYDSSNKTFNNVHKFFLSQYVGSTTVQFRIEKVPYEGINDSKPIPIYLWYDLNISDIKSYLKSVKDSPNSDPSGYGGGFSSNGGTFGGGSGGGRFDDESTICSKLPATLNKKLKSDSIYGSLIIDFHKCNELNGTNLSDYTTEYIYVFYNSRLYDNIDDILNDYIDEVGNTDIDENTPLGQVIAPFLNIINKKFPIINQIKEIYDNFFYNENDDKPPVFTLNLSIIGIDKTVKVFDFSLFEPYRNYVFDIIKISLSIVAFIGTIKIVSRYFDGGDG